jgi:hypothetical protein
MKLCALIASAILAITMTGCALGGKPKTAVPAVPVPAAAAVASPAEPLSVPQTHVQLPPPQPLNPEALVAPPPQAPPAVVSPVQPAAPATRRVPAASSAPPPPDPAPAVVVAEPARPSIQEVLPEGERSKLQNDAAASRKKVRAWLESTSARRLSGQSKLTRDRIQSFLKASDDAERRGDFREAVQLAERAEILMRELQGGR